MDHFVCCRVASGKDITCRCHVLIEQGSWCNRSAIQAYYSTGSPLRYNNLSLRNETRGVRHLEQVPVMGKARTGSHAIKIDQKSNVKRLTAFKNPALLNADGRYLLRICVLHSASASWENNKGGAHSKLDCNDHIETTNSGGN